MFLLILSRLGVYHLIARSEYGVMVQILGGLITYLLLAIYCYQNHGEPVSIKEFDNYGYKSKMNFVIAVALLIYIFSKNKNVIGYIQEPNRTLLSTMVIVILLFPGYLFRSLCPFH